MIAGNSESIQKDLVILFVKHIEVLLQAQKQVVIGVVGGRSVAAIFQRLKETGLDWSGLHLFLLDERLVARGDSESNFTLLENVLGDVKGVHLYPVVRDQVLGDHDVTYTSALQQVGGKFDIVLLSSGEDGHVASLFPGHPVMNSEDSCFFYIDDSPKPPAERVTASRKLIESASVAFLMIMGEGKRDALKLFQSDVSVEECPAKLVDQIRDSYVFTDIEDGVIR